MKPYTTPVSLALVFITLVLSNCHSPKKVSGSSGNNITYSRPQAKMLNNNTYQLKDVSDDETYGYTKENPVKVGGAYKDGAINERRFLNALLGPNGETIQYTRRGSCCTFKTPNGIMGGGLLDRYEIVYEEAHNEKPILLYINMYDYGILKAPKGFTFKQ